MKPTIEILIGAPVIGSEAAALTALVSSLNPPALILVNFEASARGRSRQVDFVVVTLQRAELVELKEITAPVRGGANGSWQIETGPGVFVPYEGQNPWVQARDAKLTLSDAMHAFAKRGTVPQAAEKFFKEFDACVAIYPRIEPGSRLPRGDYKAWIKSFGDGVQGLNSSPFPVSPSWGLKEWRTFATQHLNLKPVSLAAAIDASVFSAHQRLEEFGIRLKEQPIASLLKASQGEMVGENLIAELSSGQNVLLLGRSGLGKSFHLEHYRRRCAESGEIPVLLHAGHYRGDLNRAIHKTIGPYTSLTPAELLDAASRIGMRAALIVDDWNKCPVGSHGDLSSDLASFQVRYGARIVVACQQPPLLPFFTKFRRLELAALWPEQKRQIFAFHAGPPDPDRDCGLSEAFSTAFDLSVAARSGRGGSFPATRWELYDSYTRSRLPNPAARATARQLAWFMGENFRPFLSVAEYERISERFASELGAPVTVVEEVMKSGLVVIEGDTVAFEHDLLRDFFRSESLLRDASGQTLISRLLEPKYSDLAEFIVPNIAEDATLHGLLAHADSRLLSLGFRGGLGPQAQNVIRQQCHDMLLRTRDRLPQVKVEPVVGEFEDGRKFVSAAHTDERSSASSYERVLCAVIVDNLEDYALREAFLELLDVGEWGLKAAADEAARVQGLKPTPVWRELMRLNVVCRHSGSIHPLLLMSSNLRDTPRFGESSRPSPLRDALLERARAKSSGALVQLILMSELRYTEAIAIEDVVNLFTQAWSSGVYIIQLEALDFVHSCSSAICKEGPQAEARIIELLEGVDVSKNIMLSTQWLEARASFTDFDCGITTEDALAEYRRIIATAAAGDDPLWELEREPDATFEQFVGSFASSVLGKIFEDIFQGVYYEAYELLTAAEKQRLLTLALQDQRSHLFQSWYLRELRKVGCDGAEDTLARLGSRIDGDAFCPQETVETFAVANEVWASISDEPLRYANPSSADHRVWAIAGELIFWLSRPDGQNNAARATTLFFDLRGVPEAVPDVLRHLGSSYLGMRQAAPFTAWLAKHRDEVRAVLDCCLEHEGRLTSAFRGAEHRQRELFSWVISTLAEIGESTSIQRLRVWTGHPVYGNGAIRAIEAIEQRSAFVAGA